MASSLYIGAPGAGKTSGLLRYVILPALTAGQRVVTNIPLYPDKISEHLGKDVSSLVVLVEEADILSPRFWFCAENVGDTLTKGGDCIVIDEAHAFYGPDQNIKSDNEVFRAVRLQRKFVGGSGNFSTNILFATQLYEDIARQLRNVCSSMYYMQKLEVVGKPTHFRVDVFADCRRSPTRAQSIDTLWGNYDPVYYPLYNSYSTGVGGISSEAAGVERMSDDRLNFWANTAFTIPFIGRAVTNKQAKTLSIWFVVLMLAATVFLFNYVLDSVTGEPAAASVAASAPAPASDAAAAPGTAPPGPLPPPPSTAAPAASSLAATGPKESGTYRLVGFYAMGDLVYAVISGNGGYRYLQKGAFSSTDFVLQNAGPATHIVYRGELIGYGTGSSGSIVSGVANAFTGGSK